VGRADDAAASGIRREVPVALFLGGLDPSGGAGVLRDAVVASGLGAHPMAVPMAETVQNGVSCGAVLPPAASPSERMALLAPHLRGNWGVKLSMFHSGAPLRDVLATVRGLAPAAAIWDPVAAPSCGPALHAPESLREAAAMMAGCGWVVSPNLPEAAALAGMPGSPPEDTAVKLLDMGFAGVWMRMGHLPGENVRDLWCDGGGLRWLEARRRLHGDPRGTGCTATAAWLALSLCGLGPEEAAEGAVGYIRDAWAGLHLPGGAGRPTFPPRLA
jgi:hydroxymethylpyrimidine/phosphomethylpyrimidine kinase